MKRKREEKTKEEQREIAICWQQKKKNVRIYTRLRKKISSGNAHDIPIPYLFWRAALEDQDSQQRG
jgi:hypothetical protein